VTALKSKIEKLLHEHGPMLSGELARHYEAAHNVSNVTARQALSRAAQPVRKITKLSFDKNQKFFYLEQQFNSNKYYEALLRAIEEHSKINYVYIKAFLAQNGYISKDILPAFVSAPTGRVKNHKTHERIIDDLLQNDIISEYDETRWMLSPAFNRSVADNVSRSAGLEVAKKQIVRDFHNWAGKMNLTAFNSAHILNQSSTFAQFQCKRQINPRLYRRGFI
jgi:hypothetical protein